MSTFNIEDHKENKERRMMDKLTAELIEALKEVLELAGQPHELCADDYCEAEGYGDGNMEEHKVLEKAVQLIDKYD